MQPLAPLLFVANASATMYNMYLTGQHNIVPPAELVSGITHVSLAFLSSTIFNSAAQPTTWPLFTTVAGVRQKFPSTTKVLVSIGGWGDDKGWPIAAVTDSSRKLFAKNVAAMVKDTGADGVDIDWEYPGGNGEDYKRNPNKDRVWEIEAYPKLLAEIRAALGPDKLMSAAVPGLRRDMIAFSRDTIPHIMQSLNFLNIMTYDLMNRRDNVTKHHTGLLASLDSIDAYLEMGVPPERMSLGFAFYVKWFKTRPDGGCDKYPIGCATVLMEDPNTGADLGQAGAFSWHDRVPENLQRSFAKALEHGRYDTKGGGHYYWDQAEQRFWSWDTPEAIARKIPLLMEKKGLGGAFAWALGEDAEAFNHLKALNSALKQTPGWKKSSEKLFIQPAVPLA